MSDKAIPPPRTVWAYGYEVIPPQPDGRMRAIQALLDQEHEDARQGARTWRARLVHEQKVTHILVVSDNPAQDLAANQRLEAALAKLQARFSRTAPMEIDDDGSPVPAEPS